MYSTDNIKCSILTAHYSSSITSAHSKSHFPQGPVFKWDPPMIQTVHIVRQAKRKQCEGKSLFRRVIMPERWLIWWSVPPFQLDRSECPQICNSSHPLQLPVHSNEVVGISHEAYSNGIILRGDNMVLFSCKHPGSQAVIWDLLETNVMKI